MKKFWLKNVYSITVTAPFVRFLNDSNDSTNLSRTNIEAAFSSLFFSNENFAKFTLAHTPSKQRAMHYFYFKGGSSLF